MTTTTPPTTRAARPPLAWLRWKQWFAAASHGTDGVAPPATSATPDGRPLPQLTDYALEHVIARNDRATIYRAIEKATEQRVALKILRLGRRVEGDDKDEGEGNFRRERFLRESAAAARLVHDYIVRVHAGGVQGDGTALTGWLAMEWVHGTDLSRYTSRHRLLPEGVVLGIGARAAQALRFAHDAGIVHRDIKPSNVLFDPTRGTVKVTDFGSARIADTTTTRSGLILGTPCYMAPEQLEGAPATPQADLYGLGVTLYELLTGERPFTGTSMGELLARIARQPAPDLLEARPDLPPMLGELVARLLEKSPAARPRDAREVARELRLAQAHCDAAHPGSAAAAWADTAPGEDPGLQVAGPPAAGPSFRGTIVD